MSRPGFRQDRVVPSRSAWSLLREVGPQFARDGFGPALVFYVGWRTVGVAAGIGAASVVAAGLWVVAHRRGTRGVLPGLSLGIVAVQAVVGFATGSAELYLAQPAIVGVVVGLVFLGSAFTTRPLAGLVAADLLRAPASAENTPGFQRAFRVVTLVWAGYLLARALGRLAVLAFVSVEWFLVVTAVSGAPLMAVLALWSGAYALRALRGDAAAAWLVEGLVEVAELGS
jgi:intracellular septation protein A